MQTRKTFSPQGKGFVILLLLLFFGAKSYAQVSSQTTGNARGTTTTFQVTVASQDDMDDLISHFTTDYHEKFSAGSGNLADQTVTLTYNNVTDEDVLQIFQRIGYPASFIRSGYKYFIGSDGHTMVSEQIK